jgi:predicted DNA-binding ribbon-helix-helix protein
LIRMLLAIEREAAHQDTELASVLRVWVRIVKQHMKRQDPIQQVIAMARAFASSAQRPPWWPAAD